MTYIIFNPSLIFFQWRITTSYHNLSRQEGYSARLTDARTAVEYFPQHGMSAAVFGIAGMVSITKQGTPQKLVSIIMEK